MKNQNLLEQKATGNAGCFQRLVMRLIVDARIAWHKSRAEHYHWHAMHQFGLYWEERRDKLAKKRDYHVAIVEKLEPHNDRAMQPTN